MNPEAALPKTKPWVFTPVQISPDSATGRSWGFTSDRFTPESYLWWDGQRVLLSFVETRPQGAGSFGHLVRAIEADGYRVAVPTPVGKMVAILERWGFAPHVEDDQLLGGVEVWERK